MTLKHLVLFKFKDNVSAEKIEEHFQNVKNLQTVINEILSYKHINNVKRDKLNHDFKYGFEMEFADEQALQNYLNHEKHQEISKKIIQDLEDLPEGLLVCDFYF